jgi:hypothetical protein
LSNMIDPRTSIVQIITCLESSNMTNAAPQLGNGGGVASTVALTTRVAAKH